MRVCMPAKPNNHACTDAALVLMSNQFCNMQTVWCDIALLVTDTVTDYFLCTSNINVFLAISLALVKLLSYLIVV